VSIDIRKRLCLNRALERVDKITRAFDCDDSSAASNNSRKIDSRIAGAGAEIEHAASNRDARLFPAVQNHRTPGAMLHAQSLQFFVVRSENVIALV